MTPENDQAFASPQHYATYTRLSREVAQIIADGEAFSRHRGDAFRKWGRLSRLRPYSARERP